VVVGSVKTSSNGKHQVEETEATPEVAPPMAISIAGVSTACSKNALVSSAKAVREALSTE
jgi:hypothetical protein